MYWDVNYFYSILTVVFLVCLKDEFVVGEEVSVLSVQSKKLEIAWQLHTDVAFYLTASVLEDIFHVNQGWTRWTTVEPGFNHGWTRWTTVEPGEPRLPVPVPRRFSSSTCSWREPLDISARAVLWPERHSCHPADSVQALKEIQNTDPRPVAWLCPFFIYH